VLDPRDLYVRHDLTDPIGAGPDPDGDPGPVLVHALTGFVDAGQAGRLARDHLLETLEHRPGGALLRAPPAPNRLARAPEVLDADHRV
jgi:hypothetical protein